MVSSFATHFICTQIRSHFIHNIPRKNDLGYNSNTGNRSPNQLIPRYTTTKINSLWDRFTIVTARVIHFRVVMKAG